MDSARATKNGPAADPGSDEYCLGDRYLNTPERSNTPGCMVWRVRWEKWSGDFGFHFVDAIIVRDVS